MLIIDYKAFAFTNAALSHSDLFMPSEVVI